MYSANAVRSERQLSMHAEGEQNKEDCKSPLSLYLALLNYLAKHDLNFQNLLVLHNLVSLDLDFGETRRSSDNRFPPWSKRKNCLAELVESFKKTEKQKIRKSSQIIYQKNNQATENVPLPWVVMGHPIAAYPPGQSREICGNSAEQMSQWDLPEASSQSISTSNDGRDRHSPNLDESAYTSSETHCRPNSQAGSNTPSIDGPWGLGIIGSLSSNEGAFDSPFKLEEEVEFDGMSDLERFMMLATPTPQDEVDNLFMEDIWRFYEDYSVFGLQLPCLRGDGHVVSFSYFVPSLSAIRLFIPTAQSPTDDHIREEIFLTDDPTSPQFMTMEFEFFETLKPHVRRPLSQEIENLSTVGLSDKVLPNLPLSAIHPDSWYSVAWYPIYCIPEGKLRTSFLTFHSFVGDLIGIKYASLPQDAWIRQTASLKDAGITAVSSLISDHKNGVDRRPMSFTPISIEGFDRDRQSDLEDRIQNLQFNAERLARASDRRVDGLDPHQCYHSDFEFFHLRS